MINIAVFSIPHTRPEIIEIHQGAKDWQTP